MVKREILVKAEMNNQDANNFSENIGLLSSSLGITKKKVMSEILKTYLSSHDFQQKVKNSLTKSE